MNKPIVSIVMPSFNSERYIKESIKSVIRQDYNMWELLVVDGGSTDGTYDIVESFSSKDDRIHFINNTEDQGPAHARSVGIRSSSGHFIAFLDCDDIWLSSKLSTQIELMLRNDFKFTYTKYRVMNSKGTLASCPVPIPLRLGYPSYFFRRGIACSSVIISRSLFNEDILRAYGPWLAEDTLWWLMVLKLGNWAYGVPEPLLLYRDSSESLSKNKIYNQTSVWFIYRNIFRLSFVFAMVAYISYVADVFLRRLRYKLCTKFHGFHSIDEI